MKRRRAAGFWYHERRTYHYRGSMRGTTLLEALVALCLLGLLAGSAVPGAVGLRDRLLVERHAARVIEGYERARAAALVTGGPALLAIAADSLAVLRVEGNDTFSVWRAPGPITDGVALAATHALVAIGPHGLSYGLANGRIDLSRGQVSRGVVASRPGRLRVVRRKRGRTRTVGPRGP
ncbi:MAG TPA: hypothetical protein VGA42_00885 [Gemmatimonadales bacterium]